MRSRRPPRNWVRVTQLEATSKLGAFLLLNTPMAKTTEDEQILRLKRDCHFLFC